MPHRTEYAINGSGGGVVNIPATMVCRRVDIKEVNSAALPAQGLDIQTNEGGNNFVTTHTIEPDDTYSMGDAVAWGNAYGVPIGVPGMPDAGAALAAATVLAKLRSSTVTPTRVIVTEWE